MNQQQIKEYVSAYLADATELFLHEIVKHGIYNTGADIAPVETDNEYKFMESEFAQQANSLLGYRELREKHASHPQQSASHE